MMNRRTFCIKSVQASAALAGTALAAKSGGKLGQARLGRSGVMVPRLAFGTGTHGSRQSSDQTRIGLDRFLELAECACDEGATFFDTADLYGTHTFVREALKMIPRDRVVIMSKIWTRPSDWTELTDAASILDRFRSEIGTEVIDILLFHCQTRYTWPKELKAMRDDLLEAKSRGIVRALGVSCHSLGALETAAADDWVDVILARINPAGSHMDDTPEKVLPVLKKARERGAGVIGMKIYGCGDLVDEENREKSLNWVWKSGMVDTMTIGFTEPEQITDAAKRIRRILAL